jgi:hypothetical protein
LIKLEIERHSEQFEQVGAGPSAGCGHRINRQYKQRSTQLSRPAHYQI